MPIKKLCTERKVCLLAEGNNGTNRMKIKWLILDQYKMVSNIALEDITYNSSIRILGDESCVSREIFVPIVHVYIGSVMSEQ